MSDTGRCLMTISMAPRRFIQGAKERGRTICVWLSFVLGSKPFVWNNYAGAGVDGDCFWRTDGLSKAEMIFLENRAKYKHRED